MEIKSGNHHCNIRKKIGINAPPDSIYRNSGKTENFGDQKVLFKAGLETVLKIVLSKDGKFKKLSETK